MEAKISIATYKHLKNLTALWGKLNANVFGLAVSGGDRSIQAEFITNVK